MQTQPARPTTTDFHKPIRVSPRKAGKTSMARVSSDGPLPVCSCGWVGKQARRKKVREDRMQAHLDKKHHGRGIWL